MGSAAMVQEAPCRKWPVFISERAVLVTLPEGLKHQKHCLQTWIQESGRQYQKNIQKILPVPSKSTRTLCKFCIRTDRILNEQKSYHFCYDRSSSHKLSSILRLQQPFTTPAKHARCSSLCFVGVVTGYCSQKRRCMLARTIIAKLVAFLFVQDSVRSNTELCDVQVLLLGTS